MSLHVYADTKCLLTFFLSCRLTIIDISNCGVVEGFKHLPNLMELE